MKLAIRKSHERGQANHGWLKSQHTFSFADFYDPQFMGFRSLRVINEDHVAAGKGFGNHPHKNMEIFTYVLDGELQHQDSMGNGRVLLPGQIQLMSAGSGVTHSEYNPNTENSAHFLQIWILPNQQNLSPRYTEWHPQQNQDSEKKVLVISSDGRDHSATIHQDADVYRVILKAGEGITHQVSNQRAAWLQIMQGEVTINGTLLQQGDAAATEDQGIITITASSDCLALLFDLA
jgi:redox-sensitive bicupin YhaK (pirin superfamily)